MSKVSQLDKAIATINFILKDRRRLVNDMSQRVELNENQKIYIGRETELIKNIEYLIGECKKNYGEMLGKVPPQDLAIEEAVLGAVILEKGAQSVFSYLLPEHFHSDAHRRIYEACINLKKEGKPIDMRTVVVELRRTGSLEVIGGAYAIAEITSKVSSAANIDYHARLMIEFAVKREMIMTCGIAQRDAFDDTQDAFEILDGIEGGVKKIRSWIKE
jgi:hypothetical protein